MTPLTDWSTGQCKNRPGNDLLCVEWDVKPYTLTHSLVIGCGMALHYSYTTIHMLRRYETITEQDDDDNTLCCVVDVYCTQCALYNFLKFIAHAHALLY